MNIKLFIIIGGIGAGKSHFLKVAERLKYSTYEWSKILETIFPIINFNNDRGSILNDVLKEINKIGKLNYLNTIVKIITEKKDCKGIVLSGARESSEVAYLLGHFKLAQVVYIESDVSIRWERVKARKRIIDPKNYIEFIKKDLENLKVGAIDIFIDYCDTIIENNSTIEQFENKIEKILGYD